MRFGIDDTKYIVMIIGAILEREKYGQLCPQTKTELSTCKSYLEKVIKENPE